MSLLLKNASYLALAGSTLLLAACGGGGGSDASTAAPAATTSEPTAESTARAQASTNTFFTLQQRTAAATAVATTNSNCTALLPFYWEIGTKVGKLASGTGGTSPNHSILPPSPTTLMPIASASKWIYATYLVEKQQGVLSASTIQHLNLTSGYTNFSNCEATDTVSSCLGDPGYAGGTNGDFTSANVGMFYYGGGHMQTLANTTALGPDNVFALATAIQSLIGANVLLSYNQPQLAGGVNLTPAGYAVFLRNMLNNRYPHMLQLLGSNAVCTETNSPTCPTALFSPINQSTPGGPNDLGNLAWHYSLGHWVEDDPTIGDGAFSSLGKGGFYPWIDKTKTYYGVLTPNDPGQATVATGVPINCGRVIREAWVTPTMTFPSVVGGS